MTLDPVEDIPMYSDEEEEESETKEKKKAKVPKTRKSSIKKRE